MEQTCWTLSFRQLTMHGHINFEHICRVPAEPFKIWKSDQNEKSSMINNGNKFCIVRWYALVFKNFVFNYNNYYIFINLCIIHKYWNRATKKNACKHKCMFYNFPKIHHVHKYSLLCTYDERFVHNHHHQNYTLCPASFFF